MSISHQAMNSYTHGLLKPKIDISHPAFHFYKQSLQYIEVEIKEQHESGKASKDVVGKAWENHRKRVWENFGFTVSKERHGAMFNVDWSISFNGKLIALEEDKGHYADACMHLRACSEFAKTINNYNKANKHIPYLILHSFTKYSKHDEKLEEIKETWKPEILNHTNKICYTFLTNQDRIPANDWIGSKKSTRTNSYSHFSDNELIIKDIEFILSLVPASE